MERICKIMGIHVLDAVQPKLIGHVGDLVLVEDLLLENCQGLRDVRLLRPGEPCLFQGAPEDFHDAMGIRMVVDRTLLVGTPDEEKLESCQTIARLPGSSVRLTRLLCALPLSTRLRVYARLLSPNAYIFHSDSLEMYFSINPISSSGSTPSELIPASGPRTLLISATRVWKLSRFCCDTCVSPPAGLEFVAKSILQLRICRVQSGVKWLSGVSPIRSRLD